MADRQALLHAAYVAFNRRDSDGVLALMVDSVSWPKASEGGRVAGKEEIRAYWSRQWEEFAPTVEPVAMTERNDGRIDVRVHQVVKSLDGTVLSDSEVVHTYTFEEERIARMDLAEDTPSGSEPAPSAAFARREDRSSRD